MSEKNPTKVASSFDEILLKSEPPVQKTQKIVESMEDLVDLIEVTLEAKNKYRLTSNKSK